MNFPEKSPRPERERVRACVWRLLARKFRDRSGRPRRQADVAQVFNLLYRRFAIGKPSEPLLAMRAASGLQTRDTADCKSALRLGGGRFFATSLKPSWLALASAFGLTTAVAQDAPAPAASDPLPVLTNAQQVLDLGPDRARQLHQPVRLRGSVVLSATNSPMVFVRDETACILVMVTNALADLLPWGSVVEVQGVTESSTYAPMVDRASFQILGEGPVGEGVRLPVARLMAGEGCWQFVRIEGVVRDMNRDAQNLALSIAAEGYRFNAFVYRFNRFSAAGLPLEWLEARVLLEGIVLTDLDSRVKPIGFTMTLGHTNRIHILSPGNTNLFALPALAQAEAPRLRQRTDTRLKVNGTVAAHLPEGRIFLETDFGPVEGRLFLPIAQGGPDTETVPHEPLKPLSIGDRVALVGAPAESQGAPLLLDALYRRTASGTAPTPTVASVRALASGKHDAALVRITARLLAHERRRRDLAFEDSLVLEAGDTVFAAIWRTDSTNALPSFPVNARLQVDGICVIQPGPAKLQHAFQILLRGPTDVRYLGPTPFWARPVAGRVLGLGVVLLTVAALWVWLLRRQVQQRTGELATAIQSLSREVEERKKTQADLNRALAGERELNELKTRFVSIVSHEFRTPLGIIMSAVELLRNYTDRLPPAKREELHGDIYGSTRQMAGLMEQVLVLGRVEGGKLAYRPVPIDLEQFCGKLTDESLSATNRRCPITFRAEGPLTGAQADEALLRHIFLNLLSNAVKYSPAGSAVEFRVKRDGDDAVFMVRDSGIGIPAEDLPHLFEAFRRAGNVGEIPGTGLGMLIVKRCVELQSGGIEVNSKVGEGTMVEVRLPLFRAAPVAERPSEGSRGLQSTEKSREPIASRSDA